MMDVKTLVILAGLLGGTGVAMGAIAAHYLGPMLEKQQISGDEVQKRLSYVETGSRYQLFHAVAVLALAAMARSGSIPSHTFPTILLVLGTIIFSGFLYGIALTGIKIFGAIVPIGGTMLIVGWIWLAFATIPRP